MKLNMYDQLKHLAVKITIKKKDGKVEFGSGCLVQPETDEYSYVLTAKHCVCSDIRNLTIQRFHKEGNPVSLKIIDCYQHNEKNCDLAVIKVKKVKDLVPVKIAKPVLDKEQVILYGFPSGTANEKDPGEKINFTTNFINNKEIRITSDTVLFTFNDSVKDNIGGFSGSGIFKEFQNKIRLIGIITELRTKTGSYGELCGYIIEPINTILNKKNLYKLTIDNKLTPEENIIEKTRTILKDHSISKESIISFIEENYSAFPTGHNPYYVIAGKLVSEHCLFILHKFISVVFKNVIKELLRELEFLWINEKAALQITEYVRQESRQYFRLNSTKARPLGKWFLRRAFLNEFPNVMHFIISDFEKSEKSTDRFEIVIDQIRNWYINEWGDLLPGETNDRIDKEINDFFINIHEKGKYTIALIDYRIILFNDSIDYELLSYLNSLKTKYPSLNLFFFTGNLADNCFNNILKIEPELDEGLERDILFTYKEIEKYINSD